MLEIPALPAAVSPPVGDAHPPGQPVPDGGPPFRDVLAAAAGEPEVEAAPPPAADVRAGAEAPEWAALAALAMLLGLPASAQLVIPTPPETQPAADPAPASITTALPQPAQPVEGDLQPQAAGAPSVTAEATPEFAAVVEKALAQADTLTVSARAAEMTDASPQVVETPAPGATKAGRVTPTEAPRAAPTEEVPPEMVTASTPKRSEAASTLIEPARLAEAQLKPAPLSGEAEIVAPQIVRGLETLVRSGRNLLNLQLHPENLGRIELQVATGAEGVRVTMTADQPATSALLQHHLNDLRQTLAESGLNVTALSIGVGQGQSGNASAWQRPAPFQATAAPTATAQRAEADALTEADSGVSSRVDYRI
jgi:flagellar hook-length control protein FliK